MRLPGPVVDGGYAVRLQRGDVRPGLLRKHAHPRLGDEACEYGLRQPGRSSRALVDPAELSLARDELLDLCAGDCRDAAWREAHVERELQAVRHDVARDAAVNLRDAQRVVEGEALHLDGTLRRGRRALQERHGPQESALALPRSCAVGTAAAEDEIGVEDADTARVDITSRRFADEREGRPAEQQRLRQYRVNAVVAVRPLLAVVEDAHDLGARSGAVLEN